MVSPLTIKDEIPNFSSVEELALNLTTWGCHRCSLGFQEEINGCCIYRGNPDSRRMIIGEAPGKEEDAKRAPFTGPAGRLLDKIFLSVGMDTNKDWYLTNVVHCRPFSPRGSGKENFTPKAVQQKLCRPFLDKEIELVKPRVIVLLGKVAVSNILPEFSKLSMKELRGKIVRKDNIIYFIMYHPAAILHASYDKDLELQYKTQTWEDVQELKKLIDKENL